MGKGAIVHMLQRSRDIPASSRATTKPTRPRRRSTRCSCGWLGGGRVRPRERKAPQRLDYTKEMQRSKTLVEPKTPPMPKTEIEHSDIDQYDSDGSEASEPGVKELDEVVEVEEEEAAPLALPVARAVGDVEAETLPPKKRTPSRTPSPEPAAVPRSLFYDETSGAPVPTRSRATKAT